MRHISYEPIAHENSGGVPHVAAPDAARSHQVRDRLAAVNPEASAATLDLLLSDPSWRVRSRAYGEIYDRRKWRFIRSNG